MSQSGFHGNISHESLTQKFKDLSEMGYCINELDHSLLTFMSLPMNLESARNELKSKQLEVEKLQLQFSNSASEQFQFW